MPDHSDLARYPEVEPLPLQMKFGKALFSGPRGSDIPTIYHSSLGTRHTASTIGYLIYEHWVFIQVYDICGHRISPLMWTGETSGRRLSIACDNGLMTALPSSGNLRVLHAASI
jgi:hypothetical protein